MASIAATVRAHIEADPTIREALRLGIVNHSALARRIMDATGETRHEAVLVACRRYQPAGGPDRDAIRRVLDACHLEVRTRVSVATIRPSWRITERLERDLGRLQRGGAVHLLHGSSAITLIAPDDRMDGFADALDDGDLIKMRQGLVQLNLRSPDTVEDVPGILAAVAGALGGKNVNAVEVISCHRDNMFLIDASDLSDAMAVIDQLLGDSVAASEPSG